MNCHPERSVRNLFRPASFAGRADAESKDPLFSAMPQNPFFESSKIVTGPLLISSTSIIS
jgi:hypothetical protein